MEICSFAKVVCIVFATCVTTLTAAPSDPNSGFTMSLEPYMHLMDKLATNEESVKQCAQNQMETRHTIGRLQEQLKDTQNRVNLLQNSSLMTENEIAISLNETENLHMQFTSLNGNYSVLQSYLNSIEHDIRTAKSMFISVYNEIAALKFMSKECATCQNETALLKKEVEDLKGIIIGLQAKEKTREDDFIFLQNKVKSGEQRMASIQLNIDNLTTSLNTSLTSNGKNVSEVFKEIMQLNETNNANIQNIMMTIGELEQKTTTLESNWSKELYQISTECKFGISKLDEELKNESKIRETLINSSRQIMYNFTVEAVFREQNLAASIDKLSETFQQNISQVQADLETINKSQCVRYSNVANKLKRLEKESAEITVNLTLDFHDTLTRSMENITMVETGLQNEIDTLVKQFRTNLNDLHSNINKIEAQTNFLETSLNSSLHKLSTTNSMNTENVSKLMQELTSNLHTLQRQQNISILNISTQFDNLHEHTRIVSHNQTQAMNDMYVLFKENLSRIAVDFDGKIRQLSTMHNTSVENCELRMNNLNGQLQIFEQDVFRAVQNILKQHDNNISKAETEMMTMVNTIQISQNSSMDALLRGLIELDVKSEFIERNLSTAISNIAIACLNNISNVKSGLNDDVSRIVTTQNTLNEIISTEISSLNLKFSTLTGNLLETTRQIATIKERVALTACSNTAALNGGSVIPFVNIKFADGIPNLRNFQLTGKFTNEKPGLYLIAAHVMSYSKGAAYTIMKNSEELSRVQITPYHDDDTHNYHTGTGVAVVELVPNDDIWIKVQNVVSVMNIFGAESCMTLTKIK